MFGAVYFLLTKKMGSFCKLKVFHLKIKTNYLYYCQITDSKKRQRVIDTNNKGLY